MDEVDAGTNFSLDALKIDAMPYRIAQDGSAQYYPMQIKTGNPPKARKIMMNSHDAATLRKRFPDLTRGISTFVRNYQDTVDRKYQCMKVTYNYPTLSTVVRKDHAPKTKTVLRDWIMEKLDIAENAIRLPQEPEDVEDLSFLIRLLERGLLQVKIDEQPHQGK